MERPPGHGPEAPASEPLPRGEKAELVALGVPHDGDSPSQKLVACARIASSQRQDPLHPGGEISDEHVDMEPRLAGCGLPDGLKVHERTPGSERLQA